MSTAIKIEGLEKTLARFDVKKYEPQIQACFDKFGATVKLKAMENIARPYPKGSDDRGLLLNSVFWDKGRLSATVGDSASYASYIEFGTRKYAASYVASLPPDWQAYAASTRGKSSLGSSFDQFVQNIFAWVERKGIGAHSTKSGAKSTSKKSLESMQQAAYWIAINILQNGIKPHPYLYPAFNIAKDQLLKELNEIKV